MQDRWDSQGGIPATQNILPLRCKLFSWVPFVFSYFRAMCMLALQRFNISSVVSREEIANITSILNFRLLPCLHYQLKPRTARPYPRSASVMLCPQIAAGLLGIYSACVLPSFEMELMLGGAWVIILQRSHHPGSLKPLGVSDFYIRCQSWPVTAEAFLFVAQAMTLNSLLSFLSHLKELRAHFTLNLLLNRHINLTKTFYFLSILACRAFPPFSTRVPLWGSDLHNGRIKLIIMEA